MMYALTRPRPPYTTCLILILCLYAPAESPAQEVESGSRIRVYSNEFSRVDGVFWRVRSDSLWILPEDGAAAAAYDLGSVSRVEVYERMSRGRSAWRWTKRAFAVGAAAGAVTCIVDVENCKSSPDESDFETVTAGAFFLGGGLALFGALGGAIIPSYRWRRIAPRCELSLVNPAGAPALNIIIRM